MHVRCGVLENPTVLRSVGFLFGVNRTRSPPIDKCRACASAQIGYLPVLV